MYSIHSVIFESSIDGRPRQTMETRMVLEKDQDPKEEAEKLMRLYQKQPPFKSQSRKCRIKRVIRAR